MREPRYQDHPGGQEEQPEVYSVWRQQREWRFTRRGFVAAAGLASAALVAHLGRRSQAQGTCAQALPEPSDEALLRLGPGQQFTKRWQLRNTGNQAWGDEAQLRLVDAAGMRAPASLHLPNVQPGECIALQIQCQAPTEPGVYQSKWQVAANGAVSETLYLPLIVDEGAPALPTATPTSTPWRTGECIVETRHPYTRADYETWILTNPDPNALRTRLHLQRLELASRDCLYLYKGDNAGSFQRFYISGNGYDIWSESCEGRVIRVELAAYTSEDAWGLCIDDIQTVAQPTATPTRTPCASHCSCTTYRPCSCNPSHCYCDRICTCNLIYYQQ